MTVEVGAEVRVVTGSARHRLLAVLVGAPMAAAGAGVMVLARSTAWTRLGIFGLVGLASGLLVAGFGLRALGDRLALHEHGLVRRSRALGDKTVRFDAITALRVRPEPSRPGSVEIHAGDTLVVIDRALAADIEGLLAMLEARSGCART